MPCDLNASKLGLSLRHKVPICTYRWQILPIPQHGALLAPVHPKGTHSRTKNPSRSPSCIPKQQNGRVKQVKNRKDLAYEELQKLDRFAVTYLSTQTQLCIIKFTEKYRRCYQRGVRTFTRGIIHHGENSSAIILAPRKAKTQVRQPSCSKRPKYCLSIRSTALDSSHGAPLIRRAEEEAAAHRWTGENKKLSLAHWSKSLATAASPSSPAC